MDINIKLIVMVILISITMMSNTCHKSILGCTESSYSFKLNAQVFPNNDTLSIGDTIWVEINSPTTFMDQIYRQQVDYSNANNLGTDMAFQKFVNLQPVQVLDAVNKFNFYLLEGRENTSTNPNGNKVYLFEQVGNNYRFKLGITPKESGLFRFNVGNATGVMRNGKSCPKADFLIIITQTNRHTYFYPGSNGGIPDGPDYYFFVR